MVSSQFFSKLLENFRILVFVTLPYNSICFLVPDYLEALPYQGIGLKFPD